MASISGCSFTIIKVHTKNTTKIYNLLLWILWNKTKYLKPYYKHGRLLHVYVKTGIHFLKCYILKSGFRVPQPVKRNWVLNSAVRYIPANPGTQRRPITQEKSIYGCAFSVISGTGYPKFEIFGYPGTRKQFCKTHLKYSRTFMYRYKNNQYETQVSLVVLES